MDLLSLLSNICIYYYQSYHEKIYCETISMSTQTINAIHHKLMKYIYNSYDALYPDEDVHDIRIMDDYFGKQYKINNMDIDDMINVIDTYIDNNAICYNTTTSVISLSPNELENYVVINHMSITNIFDIFMY